MDSVIEEGLKMIKMSINMSTGFVHPNDKNRTIELLQILHKAGYQLNSYEIEEWAIENEFKSDYAKQLGEFVKGVVRGTKYKITKGNWNPNILEKIRLKANANKSTKLEL